MELRLKHLPYRWVSRKVFLHTDNTMLKHELIRSVLALTVPPITLFLLNGLVFQLSRSVKHLGHILISDLSSDSQDIERVRKDFILKANCMLHSFALCS